MKLSHLILAGTVALSLGMVATPQSASAKEWIYTTAKHNNFSSTDYRRAFLTRDNETWFYKSAKAALNREYTNYRTDYYGDDADYYEAVNVFQTDNPIFYASKDSSHKGRLAKIYYNGEKYYMNYKDNHLRRYNTWNKNGNIVSFASPTQTSKVVLKAGEHIYSNQRWYYNYNGSAEPDFLHYKLSKKGNWYMY